MAYLPLNYDKINLLEGTRIPSEIKYRSASFDYWERSLFERLTSNLIFGLPDYWKGEIENFWYYAIVRFGFLSIQDLTKFGGKATEVGMCFSPVSLTGQNFYYQRTLAVLSNPTLDKSYELEIDKDCALICMTPDKMGCWDIIERYAALLSNLDNAINMSIINNKLPYILGGKTKAAVQSLKKIMDKVNQGVPAVFFDNRLQNDAQDKDTPFQFLKLQENPKQNYLTTDQLIDLHTILSDFDAEVGIPTIPYQKKERETSYESQSKVIDGQCRSLIWKRSLLSSIENAKKLYPDVPISFRLRWEVAEDVNNEGDSARPSPISTK